MGSTYWPKLAVCVEERNSVTRELSQSLQKTKDKLHLALTQLKIGIHVVSKTNGRRYR